MAVGLAIAFGLLTALANATMLATQHVASTSHDSPRRGWALVRYLFGHPLWLLGWLGAIASLVFQALALHFGPIALVQPLLVSELVFALVLRRWWLHQRLRRSAWASAATKAVALATFLVLAAPRGPLGEPSASRWVAPSAVTVILVLIAIAIARSATPSRRAGAYAAAAALLWALEATFIKAATDILASRSLASLLTSWPLYALVVCGVLGLVAEQAALHVGPLKISQPIIVIVDPLASVVLGLMIYREQFANSPSAIAIAVVAFAVVAFGVVMLTRTVPATVTEAQRR